MVGAGKEIQGCLIHLASQRVRGKEEKKNSCEPFLYDFEKNDLESRP